MLDYDNLDISKTISLKALKKGTIESEAIGRSYDLKYRNDLIGNQADINDGLEDISIVFEVVKCFRQKTDENIEAVTYENFIGTIDKTHQEIHQGNMFTISQILTTTDTNAHYLICKTGAKKCHFIFAINSTNYGFSLKSYKNVTAYTGGTSVNAVNNNFSSTNVTTTTNIKEPTTINLTGATLIRDIVSGTTGGVGNAQVGSVARTNEIIFEPNKIYAIEIKSLSASSNTFNHFAEWYEED